MYEFCCYLILPELKDSEFEEVNFLTFVFNLDLTSEVGLLIFSFHEFRNDNLCHVRLCIHPSIS